ncbi:MAG: FAD-binding protein [Faecalibacterium sp.]
MQTKTIQMNGYEMRLITCNTVIVGTGAAGYNAADCLYQQGQKDIAMVSEHVNAGTSRNTGSDKQTYYKLSLAGDAPDSVAELAKVFYHGQCVDGDVALCEAALSAQGFYKLVGLGVPFPKNSYGEYIGYKTDHDPSKRATSVGPYTSRRMTECLQAAVAAKGIDVFDGHQVVEILTDAAKEKVLGLLCLDTKAGKYALFSCKNVVYATGGPAGMYADSVYPHGHYGASGLAFAAGVMGKNLTEWQYGIASVQPRWNVSGTYMQALPKFISTDQDGADPHEFLLDFFGKGAGATGEMLSKIFLKGYQWPFDVRKIEGGSSIIDVLVYIESCIHGRRIFLDYHANTGDAALDVNALSPEAAEYLQKAGACFGTPLERLRQMNQPAVDFYQEKGVDLSTEMLEVALCAQHNNGGLAIDKWWQTNLQGFFAVGEVSGSHGVYRPGGSALNAGQVGAARAAEYIAAKNNGAPLAEELFAHQTAAQVSAAVQRGALPMSEAALKQQWDIATKRMSRIGAAIRNGKEIAAALRQVRQTLADFAMPHDDISAQTQVTQGVSFAIDGENPQDIAQELPRAIPRTAWRTHRLYDMLLAQFVYLSAMADYAVESGQSRGSALYTVAEGQLPYASLPEIFRFTLDDERYANQTQEVRLDAEALACVCDWRAVRSLPQKDDFFENVWRTFRENGNID